MSLGAYPFGMNVYKVDYHEKPMGGVKAAVGRMKAAVGRMKAAMGGMKATMSQISGAM